MKKTLIYLFPLFLLLTSCDSGKYAPEHFLSGTWGNEAYTLTFNLQKGQLTLNSVIGEHKQFYRNITSDDGIITVYFPAYINTEKGIDQKESTMSFIIDDDNNLTIKSDFVNLMSIIGDNPQLTKIERKSGESLRSFGIGIYFLGLLILVLTLIQVVSNPKSKDFFLGALLVIIWFLSLVSALLGIPPMNTTFEAGGRLIQKITKHDSHYINFIRSFDDDVKKFTKEHKPKFE